MMGIPPNVEIKENQVDISVNPKLYPLEAVYSAAYVFMDRAYIVLDGDPEEKIIVRITPKPGASPENIGSEFNNELLNYAEYLTRARETKNLRETLLQRAIITNDPGAVEQAAGKEIDFEDSAEDDSFDDPEGIAIPWEEKYGKENEDKTEQ